MIELVDLSDNNASVSFPTLAAAGVAGAWLKATQGVDEVDPAFLQRRELARRAGLRIGGYHYADPTDSAGAQAAHFAHTHGPVGPHDLRPVLDLEQTGGHPPASLAQWVRAFNQTLLAELGVGPLFYSYRAFIVAQGWTVPLGWGLWLADYGPDDGHEHPTSPPAPWQRLVAHQYTQHGHLSGVAGDVDRTSAAELRPLLAHPPPAV